jgi:Protein of unknown function (DUF3263)
MSGSQLRRDLPSSKDITADVAGTDLRIEGVLRRAPRPAATPVAQPVEADEEWLDEAFAPLDEPGSSTLDEAGPDGTPALGEREREILAFERRWWKHAGAKEQAIRDRFQLSATRYYKLLNALLDEPAALAHDPVLVQRLRRLRASRTRTRGR